MKWVVATHVSGQEVWLNMEKATAIVLCGSPLDAGPWAVYFPDVPNGKIEIREKPTSIMAAAGETWTFASQFERD